MSLYRKLAALLATGLLALALAACGGGGGEKTPVTATGTVIATPTPRPGAGGISDEDLASMLPTKADLGTDFAGFQESAALDTNEERVQKADDPEDEKEDQQTFGRVTGYDRQLVATAQSNTALFVQIGVTLLKDSEGASDYLNDNVKDIQARVGRTDLGMLLETLDQFPVPLLGDESLGMRTRASSPPEEGTPQTVYVTYFWFRRGRIIGDVAIARVDDTDASQSTQAIASLLDEHIQQTLSRLSTPTAASTP